LVRKVSTLDGKVRGGRALDPRQKSLLSQRGLLVLDGKFVNTERSLDSRRKNPSSQRGFSTEKFVKPESSILDEKVR
jgi:hypothetical protein